MMRRTPWLIPLAMLGAAAAAAAPVSAAPTPAVQVLDPLDDAASWPAEASDSVAATAQSVAGHDGKAVEMHYDFGRVSGYAFLRKPIAIGLPRNYALRFWVRGTGGRNDFQFKLTNGDNVWWKVWRNWRAPEAWTQITVPANEIAFAWGPTEDKTLRRVAGIEFVVARNADGGAGTIAIDGLELIALPGEPATPTRAEASINDRLSVLAKAAPRGAFPRAFFGEQPYWTLAASDGGKVSGLVSEDGEIEPVKGGYSVAPVITVDGKAYRWADVAESQSLAEGRLPVPTVTWSMPNWRLDTTLLADNAGRAMLAGYRLTNTGATTRRFTLTLGVRPWQVNPPVQFLSQQGGYSAISAIAWDSRHLAITQPQDEGDPPVVRNLVPATKPDRVAIGAVAGWPGQNAKTADLSWDIALAPGASRFVSLAMPRGDEAAPDWTAAEAATLAHWRAVLGRVQLTVPTAKQPFADTLATAFSQILTSRNGPMLKPGTRSYDRAWIRDGAMMSEALLRLGRADVARAFADYYGEHLFASGKVPCCVDFRGADPVPENDSQGEYIFLVGELWRYTGDRAALDRDWPKVLGAVRYMDRLRRSERTSANQAPDTRMLYGLMPPSISHEGYSAKPQYSLWDDFWALRGYRDAADIAAALDKPEAVAIAASRDQFATDLHAAIQASAEYWKIDYIPGAVSLGDFDATSTTIALDPGGEQARLDPDLLAATFERYWREFVARRDGTKDWDAYTPYELRAIGSFVRLGWRDRIDPLLDFFFADRRPAGWNQWAEVVGKNPREVRFIGDMPHAWVASDFVRGGLDMFVYEWPDSRALVLGGGLSNDWLSGPGSSITGLATPYGTLDFAMRGDAAHLTATIGGTAQPPGGFVLAWPFATPPPPAHVDGRPLAWRDGALHVPATGKAIRIEVER